MTSAPDDNSLFELLDLAAESNGWQTSKVEDSEEMRVVFLEGRHARINVLLEWCEELGQLDFAFNYITPQDLPDWAYQGMLELINGMNDCLECGRFVYHDYDEETGRPSRIVWHYEIPTVLLGADGDQLLAELLRRISLLHDNYYPTVMGFISAKPRMRCFDGVWHVVDLGMSPDEALSYLYGTKLFGRA